MNALTNFHLWPRNSVDALPALHDTVSGTWITGFHPIVRYLSALNPRWDLDAHLTASSSQPSQEQVTSVSASANAAATRAADLTAYTTFLQTTAPPLLALSLYVSSANWAATTRPAFSTLLPFPLAWTEPPVLRNRMCEVAAHLGLSDLNIDAAGEENGGRSNDEGFLKIPESLRPRGPRGVRAALSPEQTALFRLEAAAGDGCLAVLEDLKRQGEMDGRRFFLSSHDGNSDSQTTTTEGQDKPTTLDCLAFAYLALMLVPEVPRPWLRDLIRRRYECLSLFVDGIRDELFGGDIHGDALLPWQSSSSSSPSPSHQPWRLTRFIRGVFNAVIPDEYLMPREKASTQQLLQQQQRTARKLLRVLVHSLTGASLVGGVAAMILYRHMAPLGSFVYRWEVQRRRFGAAGAFFGI